MPIGGFLNPDDRESFAKAFSHALATARALVTAGQTSFEAAGIGWRSASRGAIFGAKETLP